jgi:hypothetical protein
VTATVRAPTLRRRWARFVLRTQGRLDGEGADRLLPWLSAAFVFTVLTALDAAALRSLNGGSGLAPWLQASWRRQHGGMGTPMGGVDPAQGSWSLVAEPVLFLARWIPAEVVFSMVQAGAIAVAIVPLWRLARDQARLRVGATAVVIVAYSLAPTLHRANLSSFHPELVALPALLWAYLHARQGHWRRYAALVLLVMMCRADLGLTVAALGVVLVTEKHRGPGVVTIVGGLGWSIVAALVLGPEAPDGALTPAGEFVARSTTPLAVFPRLLLHPISEARELFAQPSVLFLVVALAPLLFLPLVSARKVIVALPSLALAMIADRSVQRAAQVGVLNLSPAAAHIGPAAAFLFVALVFALERVGEPSVTRVNVDRRVLLALLAGAVLFFVTEAPSSPYRQPWAWGSQDSVDGARLEAADMVDDDEAVAVSPADAALVARRAKVVELPPDPADLTASRVADVSREVDVVLLDTSDRDPLTGDRVWVDEDLVKILDRFAGSDFRVAFEAEGIYLLRLSDRSGRETGG